MQKTDGTFVDLPLGTYVGCKGLKKLLIWCKKEKILIFPEKNCNFFVGSDTYSGGYYCSLWTLWHVLTVNQYGQENPPSKVITQGN